MAAMAARASPASNILRKSRLFALPSAIPPPPIPLASGPVRESNSATTPYPMKAAIETPLSSLRRGDWGLKRPLPAKSTRLSSVNPLVRINRLDTYEHVTDFHSANDHTLTLRKYQELNLPISSTAQFSSALVGSGRHSSVFEKSFDNIRPSTDQSGKRYRFKGPWLAGMRESEFQQYLKTVRKQRPEFLQRLRAMILQKKVMRIKRELMDEGKSLQDADVPKELSEAEFESALLALRADPSTLGPEIYRFLDLATPPKIPDRRIHMRNWVGGPSDISSPLYARDGPPATHPSAGLSYLRTKAHLDNHPVTGPQREGPPVEARLLRSRLRVKGQASNAVGVAGFVTTDLTHSGTKEFDAQKESSQFNMDTPGGVTSWVRAERATVDAEGKVNIRVDAPQSSAKALHGVPVSIKSEPSFVRERIFSRRLDER